MVEEQRYGSNAELASIAAKAYDALSNGEPWEQVKAHTTQTIRRSLSRHLWDWYKTDRVYQRELPLPLI